MTRWSEQDVATLDAHQEVQVVTSRRDGTSRAPVTIWVVTDDGEVFVRSTNGRGAGWFRAAVATGAGRIVAGGTAYEVAFTEASPADLDRVDGAYRRKYGRYPSIVAHLAGSGPRAATLRVHPA